LIARDPATPIHLDLGGLRGSLVASLQSLARPVVAAMDEVLGGKRTGRTSSVFASDALATASDAAATEGTATKEHAPSRRARLAGAASRHTSHLAGHHRLASLGACLLLVAVAAVGALPPVSAASRADPTPSASPAPGGGDDMGNSGMGNSGIADQTAADQTAADQTPTDQTPTDQGIDTYVGDGSVSNTIQAGDAPVASGGFQTYVVKGGDNLKKVAAKFGIGVTTLYWANKSKLASPDSIQIGLRLLIPPVDGVVVAVKAKDTLSSLASKYHVAVQDIIDANNLADTTVTVGQTLIVPGAAVAAIPAPATPKPGCAAGCGGSTWNGGKLRWPVVGTWSISQYYSATSHPAIDIAAKTGTPVVAAAGGTVIFAGWKNSGGGYGGGIEVWISHGGKLWTTYNHLSAEFVRVGQTVSAGQRIGNVGMTGNATGPHLHFEVWVCYPWADGTTSCARNPLNYLR
jgi:murein DD-endopeptidase MepM/ murein hydrolase activator NlpD